MSHSGCALVWHVQPRVVIFPCPTHYCPSSVKCHVTAFWQSAKQLIVGHTTILIDTVVQCWWLITGREDARWHVFMLQHAPADVWVVKESELGSCDQQVHCRTHLGHLLCPGDVVLGLVQSLSLRHSLSLWCCLLPLTSFCGCYFIINTKNCSLSVVLTLPECQCDAE